ncbi:hypothetical protein EUGRSUZ_J03074, partial [Eucalyptus grandis]
MTGLVGQTSVIQGENSMPPAVGMEFESYEDVYYFYSCYAKEHGFGVRVSNTWYRKSKERYRGKLSCSSAGFKKKSEANLPRPETRIGCPAMIKFRLMDNTRWRIIEVELEHNHLISPTSPEEVETVKLFQTVIIDAEGGKLAADDAHGSNFFYVADLNERGCLRNLFWAAARSRVAYRYFGDVVAIDTTFFGQEFDNLPVSFIGVNHHGQPVLLGCGLLAGETVESYVWLLRAWLTCILGHPPQTIISDQCKALQAAIFDVFPRASHCMDVTKVMRRISERLEKTYQYETIKAAIYRAVCLSQRAEEFEAAWMDIIHEHGLEDHQWFQSLYEERNQWVPVNLKETFLAGMFRTPLTIRQNEDATSFFKGYIGNYTSLKEFLDKCDQAMQKSHQLDRSLDFFPRIH